MMTRVNETRYIYGSTNTAAALRSARTNMFQLTNGDRPDAQDIIIFVTDGESNLNADQTLPEARLVHNANIELVGIGINLYDTSELSGIASSRDSRYLQLAEDFEDLPNVMPHLLSAVCSGESLLHLCSPLLILIRSNVLLESC